MFTVFRYRIHHYILYLHTGLLIWLVAVLVLSVRCTLSLCSVISMSTDHVRPLSFVLWYRYLQITYNPLKHTHTVCLPAKADWQIAENCNRSIQDCFRWNFHFDVTWNVSTDIFKCMMYLQSMYLYHPFLHDKCPCLYGIIFMFTGFIFKLALLCVDIRKFIVWNVSKYSYPVQCGDVSPFPIRWRDNLKWCFLHY